MNTDLEKYFPFGDSCYFDMASNTIVDLQEGQAERYTPVSATEGAVLGLLVRAYPDAVPKEQLCAVINADCDNSDVRRVINKLKNRHPQLKLWIPRGREGEYRLREPVLAQKTNHVTRQPETDASCTLKSTGICVRPNFVLNARLDIFGALDEAFQESHVVFLQGIGGIGKSEAAKHWALRKKKEGLFHTVVFAQLNAESGNSNVQSLIADDTIFVISGAFRTRDEGESIESYFHRKLAKIKQLTDERTLIVVDNYDLDDPLLAALFTGPYRLLVTTRSRQTGYDFPLIPVSEIQEPEHLKDIFFKNLGDEREDIDSDDPYIEKVFSLVSNHTLTIEIIAKSLVNSVDTPESLYKKISDPARHILLHGMDGLVERNFSEEPMPPFECIRRLFNLSRLEQDRDFEYKSQVLVFLAAMPTRGIELSLFKRWSDGRIIRAKNSLVRKSWLRQDTVNGVPLLSMHPLIREIVWYELKPSLEKCCLIINGFERDNSAFYNFLHHQSKHIKDMYERITLSLMSAFPVQELRWFHIYVDWVRVLSNCANPGAALQLTEQIKRLMERQELTNTFRYGLIHFHIGLIYSSIFRDCEEGAANFELALERMVPLAHTDEEKMWLAILYREMVCMECRDEMLFRTHAPSHIEGIEQLAKEGENLVRQLRGNGFSKVNLDLYHGAMCVWRSKIAIYRGDLDLANVLIDTAEAEFSKSGYPNLLDKAEIADIRSLIYASKGAFHQQIRSLRDSMSVFEGGYGKYHRASIERAIKLAAACQNSNQPEEAIRILTHYLQIAEQMLDADAALVRTIRYQLEQLHRHTEKRTIHATNPI